MSLIGSFTAKSASNIWTAVVGFVTSVVLNRLLGATNYGTLVLAYAAAMFCWHFVDLGAGAALSRYLPQYAARAERESAATLVNVGWQCVAVGILGFGVSLWVLADWLAVAVFRQPHLAPFIRLGVAYFTTFSLLSYALQFLQAIQSWAAESWFSALYPTLYLAGCVLWVVFGRLTVTKVLVINALAALLTAGILWCSVSAKQRPLLMGPWRLGGQGAGQARHEIFHFGTPLLFNNLVFFVMVWADKVLLSRYRSLEELTYYYVGFAFFNALVIVSKTFYTVLLPYVSGIATQGIDRTRTAFKTIFFVFLQLSLGMSLLTFVAVDPLVRMAYGAAYNASALACKWLLAVFVLRTLINAMGLFLLNAFGLGKTSALLSLTLIGCQIGGSLLLIPRYGWLGAVWANIAAYVIYGLAMALGIRSIRTLFSWPLLAGAIGIGAGMVGLSVLLMRLAPAYQLLTVPALVFVVGWLTVYPILQERYHWKPMWSSLVLVGRFYRA